MSKKIQDAFIILRRKEVESRTGLSRSTIYARIAAGEFPAPINLGSERAVGWLEAEVNQWIKLKISESRRGI